MTSRSDGTGWAADGSDEPYRQSPHEPKRRPVLRANPPAPETTFDPLAGLEVAEQSAARLVAAGHGDTADIERLVHLPEEIGLDTVASMWARGEPGTLPSALWALYALRAWCHSRPSEVGALAAAGCRHAEVAASVAGVGDHLTPREVTDLGDDLVRGAIARDLATALHRAAALARVLAAGRGALGRDSVETGDGPQAVRAQDHAWSEALLGARLLATADSLDRAAVACQ